VRLSIVIPVFDEAAEVASTVRSVRRALEDASSFVPAEVIVADDGSTVDVATPAGAEAGPIPLRTARLSKNSGRFAARRAGLEAATGELVLFIDAGVLITKGSLAFLDSRLAPGRDVWNAHTIMETRGNPFALFWSAVSAVAFGDYVGEPRETSFGVDEFDRFPKGTTCFLAPRDALLEAFAAFRSSYDDTRNANDDGPIIRFLAARSRINIAPGFACVYTPRRTLRSFVKHALHRGVVFVDGHGRRESRFFPFVIAFFPISGALALAAIRRPWLVPLTALTTSVAAGGAAAAKRRPAAEVGSLTLLAPVYAAAHGLGMWRGLMLAAAARLRGAR
jgi:glycosyltransferase involved in cell wall biosynthesis